jgi:hypothetical protein
MALSNSSWKHIYLKLRELGRLESYVIHHLKKQMTNINVLTLSLVCAKQFCAEEATTYTSG